MITAICLAVPLLLAACHTKEPASPLATQSQAAVGEDVRPAPPSAEQEAALKKSLEEQAGGSAVQFVCMDYDADGTYEAFAIVGALLEEGGDLYAGSLWFVSESRAEKIAGEDTYFSLCPLTIGPKTLIASDKVFATGSITGIYGVRDGAHYEDPLSGQVMGLKEETDGSFTALQDAYDANTDGSGHTWKPYWFYWDEGFHEYGASLMSQEEFGKLDGADQALEQISGQKGQIVNILQRGNGIIHINYQIPWERPGYDEAGNYFLTLRESAGAVSIETVDDNSGVYLEALLPSIAVYPR